MTLEKKTVEKITEKFYECPHCSCTFATKSDLDGHIQAWGNNKEEHIRQLDRAHRANDRSFRGTMAKEANEKRKKHQKL